MARQDGSFYKEQVKYAVEEYKRKNPDRFKVNISGDFAEGYEKWCKANPN